MKLLHTEKLGYKRDMVKMRKSAGVVGLNVAIREKQESETSLLQKVN